MTGIEIKRALKLLNGMFPNQLTDDLTVALAEKLNPFSYAAAERAIKNHPFETQFLNLQQLIRGCQSAERAAKVAGYENAHMNAVDIFRQRRPDLADASDIEVILRTQRNFAERARKANAGTAHLVRESVGLLISVGLTVDDAKAWADYVDMPGSQCQEWLDRMRETWPARSQNEESQYSAVA